MQKSQFDGASFEVILTIYLENEWKKKKTAKWCAYDFPEKYWEKMKSLYNCCKTSAEQAITEGM